MIDISISFQLNILRINGLNSNKQWCGLVAAASCVIVAACEFFVCKLVLLLLVAAALRLLRSVHMERFAYVCKFCIYAKFAYVCKSLHVYAFTHVCKICTYAKVGKFAPASDQVQISFCVYANFAYMQIWSCERKAKFAHVSIYLIVLNNPEMTLFQDCNYLVNNLI